MNFRIAMSFVALLAAGCATNVAGPDEPAAVAEVQLLSMTPAAGSELTAATVLVAEIKYSIQNYKPKVDYYVAPVFASTQEPGTRFNMLDRISDAPVITASAGTVTVRYPISRELASPKLERPVRLWFFVMERTGPGQTLAIGMTEELRFNATGG